MPFPLAHPAAVLPLRRYCPQPLSFAALVVGSLAPDFGYAFGETGVSDFSHTFLGGTAFGVVSGFLVLGLFYALRNRILELIPSSYEQEIRGELNLTTRSLLRVLVSLGIGVWTHLFLDSFTHSHGWWAEHVSLLRAPVFAVGARDVRVCHVLWYLCSFAGLVLLVVAARQWQGSHGPRGTGLRRAYVLEGFVVAFLVLPIEVLHHFVHSRVALLLLAAASLALSLLVLARPLNIGIKASLGTRDGGT